MDYDFIILGSGLTAYAALLELAKTDATILMIDYGLNQNISKQQLKYVDLKHIEVGDTKKFIGDDFATKTIPKDLVNGLDCSNSYAFGGLSNVWGCSIERFDEDEFLGWPDIKDGLNDGYDLLDKSIANLSPLDSEVNHKAQHYYFNKLQNQEFKNIELRKSILAISDSACIRCGECLYGCRHEATFNSKDYIQHLINTKRIEYLNGLQAYSVNDGPKSSAVNCVDVNGGIITFNAKKILLCTGAINTAKIMLRSFETIKYVEVKDSQYFILPLFGLKAADQSNLIALSQFVLKQSNVVKNKKIHYQFYTPSAYTDKIIDQKLSLFPFRLPNFIKNRIFILQGYLPSGLSSSVSFSKSGDEIIANQGRSFSNLYLRYCLNVLKRVFLTTYLVPVMPLLNVPKTFSGYHFGASFPMSDNFNHENNTDTQGRIKNVRNIHILDSSVLPSIPSGSYSYTVMANAIRIVKQLRLQS